MKVQRNQNPQVNYPWTLIGSHSGIIIRGFERREDAVEYLEHYQKFEAQS